MKLKWVKVPIYCAFLVTELPPAIGQHHIRAGKQGYCRKGEDDVKAIE